MRKLGFGCCAALLFAGALMPVRAQVTRNSLTPQHRAQLIQEINQCAQRVNAARTPEERCKEQEQLCKKLLQVEDFDRALQVASAVHSTPGVNAERRAAHHFLMAKIYAMRMEASSTTSEMEKNRQLALSTARDVVAQKYPEQWMVGRMAQNLINELQDSRKIVMTRAKVAQRQGGGTTAGIEQYADMQEKRMRYSVQTKTESLRARAKGLVLGKKSGEMAMVSSEPAKEALTARLARSGRKSGIVISDSSTKSSTPAKTTYSRSGVRVSDADSSRNVKELRGSGRIKEGALLIQGDKVFHVSSGTSNSSKTGSSSARR